jgi:hypothetical protein
MSANRLLYVVIAVALVAIAAFTFSNARATTVLTQADRQQPRPALGIIGHRGGINPNLLINEQPMTTSGTNEPTADRSYDAIENLRVMRAYQK